MTPCFPSDLTYCLGNEWIQERENLFWQWDLYFPRLCYTVFCPEIQIKISNQINAQKNLSFPILVATVQSHCLKIHCASLFKKKLLFYTLKK